MKKMLFLFLASLIIKLYPAFSVNVYADLEKDDYQKVKSAIGLGNAFDILKEEEKKSNGYLFFCSTSPSDYHITLDILESNKYTADRSKRHPLTDIDRNNIYKIIGETFFGTKKYPAEGYCTMLFIHFNDGTTHHLTYDKIDTLKKLVTDKLATGANVIHANYILRVETKTLLRDQWVTVGREKLKQFDADFLRRNRFDDPETHITLATIRKFDKSAGQQKRTYWSMIKNPVEKKRIRALSQAWTPEDAESITKAIKSVTFDKQALSDLSVISINIKSKKEKTPSHIFSLL